MKRSRSLTFALAIAAIAFIALIIVFAFATPKASAGAGGDCSSQCFVNPITEVIVNGDDVKGLAVAAHLATLNPTTVIHRVHTDAIPDRVVGTMTNEANLPDYLPAAVFVIGDESQVSNYTGLDAARLLGLQGFNRLVDSEAVDQLVIGYYGRGGVPAG